MPHVHDTTHIYMTYVCFTTDNYYTCICIWHNTHDIYVLIHGMCYVLCGLIMCYVVFVVFDMWYESHAHIYISTYIWQMYVLLQTITTHIYDIHVLIRGMDYVLCIVRYQRHVTHSVQQEHLFKVTPAVGFHHEARRFDPPYHLYRHIHRYIHM